MKSANNTTTSGPGASSGNGEQAAQPVSELDTVQIQINQQQNDVSNVMF
jgi:hypothetical protein